MTNLLTPEQLIENSLGTNEKVLWMGRPKQGVAFRTTDFFMVPFSILWCGFALFWEGMVIQTNAPFFFKLWGIPFVILGLYITIGRFFFDARQRAATAYAVTSERAIIATVNRKQKSRSIDLRSNQDVNLEEKSDGSGNIAIGPPDPFGTWRRGIPFSSFRQGQFCFEFVPNVTEVYTTVRSVREGANNLMLR